MTRFYPKFHDSDVTAFPFRRALRWDPVKAALEVLLALDPRTGEPKRINFNDKLDGGAFMASNALCNPFVVVRGGFR